MLFNIGTVARELYQASAFASTTRSEISASFALAPAVCHFAAHPLGEKLERPANRFVALEVIAELPRDGFSSRASSSVMSASLREDRDLRGDARIKEVNGQPGRLQAVE